MFESDFICRAQAVFFYYFNLFQTYFYSFHTFYSCARGYPDVNLMIPHVHQWIEDVMNGLD